MLQSAIRESLHPALIHIFLILIRILTEQLRAFVVLIENK